MGNLDAKLLDVGRRRSRANWGGIRLLRNILRLQRLPRGERLGKCSWPGRFLRSRGWRWRGDMAGCHRNWRWWKKIAQSVRRCRAFNHRRWRCTLLLQETPHPPNQFLRLEKVSG